MSNTATYSLSALQECRKMIRKTHWSARKKRDHIVCCGEVRDLYAKCQVLLNSFLFSPDYSPACDYLLMVTGQKATKKELDVQLKACKQFAVYQLDMIDKGIADGVLNSKP